MLERYESVKKMRLMFLYVKLLKALRQNSLFAPLIFKLIMLKINKSAIKYAKNLVHRMLKVYNRALDFYKNC